MAETASKDRLRLVLVAALLAATAAVATPHSAFSPFEASTAVVDPALGDIQGPAKIIVRSAPAQRARVARALERAGAITRDLPIIDGFAATVPSDALARLAHTSGVLTISLDRRVRMLEGGGSSTLRSVYPKAVRADKVWQAGADGTGVTVALIDTGIADVADLAGRVVTVSNDLTGATATCANFSGESTCGDSYGHGTFMAGIIAGDGAGSAGAWKGVAPGARLVSVKIAGADGAADVSNLLAAIQWVVAFKDKYGIRVLNLSLGTDSTQSYTVDPLNYAVERAWFAGIVVVVSASNKGPQPRTISKPADDPWVITVGAVDDRTTPGLGDDLLPNFTSRGPTAADGLPKPDVVAPGAHMVSLRAPGSVIDTRFPSYIDGSYRRGSGTSMSAGVVSGAVALMLQANPAMAPDRVKYALTSTARPAASTDPTAVGAGEIDVHAGAYSAPPGLANVGNGRSSGMGSLDASRGTVQVRLANPTQTILDGMLTAQLLLFDPVGFLSTGWSGGQWYGAQWYGAQWYGAQWYGAQWYGGQWYGAQWYGTPDGAQWYGAQWYGAQWYGSWE